MKKIVSMFLALSMLLTTFSVAFADAATDASYQTVLDKGQFVMGIDDSFPPMGFRDENGNIVGFDIDVATEVCKRMGVELVLQPIAWASKNLELDGGNIDCIWNGFTITDERLDQLSFSEPYMANEQEIVVLADSPVQTLADLNGKNLGVQAGSSAVDALDANPDFASTVNVSEFKDNMLAMMDLENGGVDAVLVDSIVAGYYFSQKGIEKYRILDEKLAIEEYGIGFRKADIALTENVNRILNEMAEDGTLAEISTKWFAADISTIGKTAEGEATAEATAEAPAKN